MKKNKTRSRHEVTKNSSKVNVMDTRVSQDHLNADIGFLISADQQSAANPFTQKNTAVPAPVNIALAKSQKRIRDLNSVGSNRSPESPSRARNKSKIRTRSPQNQSAVVDSKLRRRSKMNMQSLDGNDLSKRKDRGSSIAIIN